MKNKNQWYNKVFNNNFNQSEEDHNFQKLWAYWRDGKEITLVDIGLASKYDWTLSQYLWWKNTSIFTKIKIRLGLQKAEL